jgi:hypothetical protein
VVGSAERTPDDSATGVPWEGDERGVNNSARRPGGFVRAAESGILRAWRTHRPACQTISGAGSPPRRESRLRATLSAPGRGREVEVGSAAIRRTSLEAIMRRLSYLLLLSLLLVPAAASAATSTTLPGATDLTANVGWQYWGTVPYYSGYYGYEGGNLHLNANVNYGGEFTRHSSPYTAVQLSYSYQSTDMVLQGSGASSDVTVAKTAVQYIQIYGVREMPSASGVTTFVKGGLGTTIFSSEGYSTQWRFSLGMGFGVQKQLNDKVSLKLTQRFLLPMQWASGGVYVGTGGSGITVGGGTAIIQGDTSLGK